ncbi:hypothetical protein HDV06_003214 [Boothiomyces sp. JEL0866]|nr:hypothetical protein HDV06_003214 [Boothiomyces sp. JEL0866]
MLLLLITTSKGQIIQSMWSNKNCHSSPSAFYIFPENQTTEIYSSINEEFPVPVCGLDPVPRYTSCCFSSVDPKYTLGYQSISIHILSSKEQFEQMAPSNIGQSVYCQLDYGETKRYILNGTSCFDGYICQVNSIEIYDTRDCANQLYNLAITSDQVSFYETQFGEIGVTLKHFVNGTITYGAWTASIPQSHTVLGQGSPFQLAALVFFIIPCIGTLKLVYRFTREAMVLDNRHRWILSLSQVLYLILHLLVFTYQYIVFPTEFSALSFKATMYVVMNLGQFFTFMVNVQMILKILYISRFVSLSVNIFACFVHFGLVGWIYLYVIQFTYPAIVALATFELSFTGGIWIFCMSLTNILSPVILVRKMQNSPKYEGKWLKRAYILGSCQIIIATLYIVLYLLRSLTEMAGSDINFMALQSFFSLFIYLENSIVMAFHSMLESC